MFAPKGLFRSLPCPNRLSCSRDPCPYSHESPSSLPKPPSLVASLRAALAPVVKPIPSSTSVVQITSPAKDAGPSVASTSSLKRTADDISGSPERSVFTQPPKKLQKADPKPIQPQHTSPELSTQSGAPRIQASIARSNVPIPVRQTMLTTVFEHFRQLYSEITSTNPGLPAQHALAQEVEVYEKSTKITYRNAMISAIATIKKRPPPDSKDHPSVGTNSEVAVRTAKLSSLSSFELLPSHLGSLVLSRDAQIALDYVVDVPPGTGGDRPNEVGNMVKCERCAAQFVVKEDPPRDQCEYHWSRPYTTKIDAGPKDAEIGVHVFSEKDPEALHSRHAFTISADSCRDESGEPKQGALDVCAMDCEMIYTTAGMSVARVSVVDGKGERVFDEHVRMSEGVQVLFSGISSLSEAVFDLDHVRLALGAYIGPNTIVIGHALENDLKTLRMIHGKVIDTCAIYPHKMGPPYRRALRDLARDYLGQFIQTGGGSTGHSSLEDARATLDLVRCWVLDKGDGTRKPK
ncbi:hypothetical protein BS47DRAFT_1372581 [Hydnum rufescens UP504]|uniref:Exonuclease domain-containing protein n=1 Tax=Hydnum rufescens UP504 TaxID=1448309 RepID=A0A9P6AWD4_9AGAM|nr:hypothetical protein BS47DRAFT_1372581 [Hydnum rufescens UP504]